jgi:WD40 repeat protein
LLVEYWDKNEAVRGLTEWEVATGKKLRSWPRATTQGMPVVSDDGRWCLIRPTNIIGQYPLNYEGELVIPHDAPCSIIDLTSGLERQLEGVQAGFRSARFSRDGQFFVAPTGLALSVWETKTFQKVKSIAATGSVLVPQGALFSPDGGRVVAVASGAEAVRFWDHLSGEQVLSLPVPGARLSDPGFSPDGNWLGAVGRTGGLYLWRAPSWAEIEAAEKR